MNDLFDVYLDQFLSGPLEPTFYTSISNAVTDCLSDSKCTGIVQDYQYFRRTRGINTIIADKETATSYVRRGTFDKRGLFRYIPIAKLFRKV